MPTKRITKRTVDALKPKAGEFTIWDDAVSGFGVRVRPTGTKSYVVVYRAGSGRGAPVRRYTTPQSGNSLQSAPGPRPRSFWDRSRMGMIRQGRKPPSVVRQRWPN
jgi:hypothetical protein